MADVFISYVEENSPLAIEIAHAVERMGVSAWYYERDSVPGRSYLLQTGEEIDACRAVILLISSHSIHSYQVKQEVVRAYESNKPFIPLLIDISHGEFQQCQPEWRAALGATASLRIPPEGIQQIVPHLTRSLAALGILPPEHESLSTGRGYQLGEDGHSNENVVFFWNPHNTFQKEPYSQCYASRTAYATTTRLCNGCATSWQTPAPWRPWSSPRGD